MPARVPVCRYGPWDAPALVCDRRHRQGEGNHLDSARGLWFGHTRAGVLKTFPLGLELSGGNRRRGTTDGATAEPLERLAG